MTERSTQPRVSVVTGVSRKAGIGFAVARRLLASGHRVVIHSWTAHDAAQPWGAEPGGVEGVIEALGDLGPQLAHVEADLGLPGAPELVVDAAFAAFGALDVLVANHAHSSEHSLGSLTVDELDRAWAVKARAVVLLVQAFADRRPVASRNGRILLFTSGQQLAPMADELPYAISKGAVHQATRSLADALADRGITVNAINSGPVDTGWASAALREELRPSFPSGRWGQPDDIAKVACWLISPDSAWITGQVIDAEGGFRR